MTSYILFFFVFGTISAHHLEVPAGRPLAECERPGLMCESCTGVVVCIANADGSFSKLPIETCVHPETCLDGACTTDPNPDCETYEDFVCNDLGVFPDQFDCLKFHFCVRENSTYTSYDYECEGDFSYNPRTTYCDRRMNGAECALPVPACEFPGQNGALEDNDSIYYVCQQTTSELAHLYPYLYLCPHGGVYSNYTCTLRD